MTQRILSILSLTTLLGACGTTPVTPVEQQDAGSQPESDGGQLLPDAGMRRMPTPLPDAGVVIRDNDGNATFDDAVETSIGASPVTGTNDGLDDLDYISFDGTEGQAIAVILSTGGASDPFGPPSLLNALLLGPDRRPLTDSISDYGCTGRDHGGSEIITFLPTTGRHYLEVQALGGFGGSGPSDWSLEIIDLETSPATVVVRSAATAELTAAHRCVLGRFEQGAGGDTVQVSRPGAWSAHSVDPGRHGSTGTARTIDLLSGSEVRGRYEADAIGEPWIAVNEGAGLSLRFMPPETRESNDHYFIQIGPFGLYAGVGHTEADDSGNDTADGAETIAPRLSEGGYANWIATELGDGDVDHFAFTSPTPGSVQVTCAAQVLGSGVRDLRATLLGPSGEELARGGEAARGLQLSASGPGGRYVLRLEAGTPDSEIAGRLVGCRVTTPDAFIDG